MHHPFHFQQPFSFFAGDPADRHSCPHGHHFSDVFSGHLGLIGGLIPAFTQLVDSGFELDLSVTQVDGIVVALGVHRLFLFLLQLAQAHKGLTQVGSVRGLVHAHAAARLVDQVDRFVRHKSVRNIAGRQMGGRVESLVGDDQLVVLFVAGTHPPQDLDRLFDRRLVDQDRLEAPFERSIALDMFAVFVQCRSADHLQFAPAEGRLQDIGGIDAAPGSPCAHQHVDLVDKKDRLRGYDFFDHLFQPLFKLAPVHGACHQAADIQHQQPFVEQRFGHVTVDDPLGQPFDDRSLADARFADQRRVVFGAAAQNLDHTFDFWLAADHRVELALFGGSSHVVAELVDQRGFGLFFLFVLALGLALQDVARCLGSHPVKVDAEPAQHIDGNPLPFSHKPQQQVLGANVVVAHQTGFVDGQFDHTFGAGGQCRLPKRRAFSPSDGSLDGANDLDRLDTQLAQHLDGHPVFLAHQSQQQVLGSYVVVVEPERFFLRQRQHAARTLGKAI